MENLKKPKLRKSATPPDRLLLRLPYDLREQVQKEAKEAGRTMTAEILLRLEVAYRFHTFQIEQAVQREYIITRQVERAIKHALTDSPRNAGFPCVSKDKDLEKLHDAVDSLSASSVTTAIVRRQVDQIDLVISDVLEMKLGEEISQLCWLVRIALGMLVTSSDREATYSSEVRNNLSLIARHLREHINGKEQ